MSNNVYYHFLFAHGQDKNGKHYEKEEMLKGWRLYFFGKSFLGLKVCFIIK